MAQAASWEVPNGCSRFERLGANEYNVLVRRELQGSLVGVVAEKSNAFWLEDLRYVHAFSRYYQYYRLY